MLKEYFMGQQLKTRYNFIELSQGKKNRCSNLDVAYGQLIFG